MTASEPNEATPAPIGFTSDASAAGLAGAARAYISHLRSGETGALPALGGLVVLFVAFSLTKDTFLSDGNFANLLQQATWLIILAMAVTFVLLIGEIDLAAGVTMGVTGAVVYLRVDYGMPPGITAVVSAIVGLGLAALVANILRGSDRSPASAWAIGLVAGAVTAILLGVFAPEVTMAVLLGMLVGILMGAFTGFLVARVGIPSFVVTLALFLGWQGLLLRIAKEGGSIRIDDKFLRSLGTAQMRPVYGWILFGVVVVGFFLTSLLTRRSRVRKGVSAQPLSVIILKGAVLAAAWGFGTFRLNHNRATRNATAPIEGVPWVVPLVLVLTLVLTFLLARTAWGRHLYAVGGNVEAARRAGINVVSVRLSAFVMVGFLASIAGLAYGSRTGSITPQSGAGTELLRAVGAAVVGGVSLFGGRGKIVYAVVGGLVLTTIDNGLGLFSTIFGTDVDAGLKNMVAAGVLLLAGGVDALTRRSAGAAH